MNTRETGVIPESVVRRFADGWDPPYTIMFGPWQRQAYIEFIEHGDTRRTERLMKVFKQVEHQLKHEWASQR